MTDRLQEIRTRLDQVDRMRSAILAPAKPLCDGGEYA